MSGVRGPRRLRDLWPGFALALATVLLFGRGLGRAFVSEDFLILRRLHEGGWPLAWGHFVGPWLDTTVVSFYRPVASLLLSLQYAVFGASPAPYLLVHLAVHLLNAYLVWRIASSLWRRSGLFGEDGSPGSKASAGPWTVAALFALYPLHPNTVLFVASFATLFGTTFGLGALVLHIAPGGDTGPRRAAAFGCVVLALGCYEQAAVLPAMLLAVDLICRLGPKTPGSAEIRPWGLRLYGLYGLLLAAYFGLRKLALGGGLGGYGTFHERLHPSRWPALAADTLTNLARWVYPDYELLPTGWMPVAAGGGLLIGAALSLWILLRRDPKAEKGSSGGVARLWLMGWTWWFLAQAPFLFAAVVPGNGRYAYLGSVAFGLGLVATTLGVTRPLPARFRKAILGCLALAAAFGYGRLLVETVEVYSRAGEVSRRVQARLPSAEDCAPCFLVGAPDFLHLGRVPAAQVFHWGLADADGPPFTERERTVYDLPKLGDPHFGPLLERFGPGSVRRWDGSDWVPVAPAPLAENPGAADGQIQRRPGVRYRLVAVAPGGHHLQPEAAPATSDVVDLTPPEAFVGSMTSLYGDAPIYAWVEGLDPEGRVVQAGSVRRWPPAGD
ncbi:MAG: hypothetical protein AAGD06_20560 [Acidobacteriota bacterium]